MRALTIAVWLCAGVLGASACQGAVGDAPDGGRTADAAPARDGEVLTEDSSTYGDAEPAQDATSPRDGALDASLSTDATPAPDAEPMDASEVVDPPALPPGPVDTLLAGLSTGTWALLPSTPMQPVCPGYIDGQPGNHYLCGAVMSAWSGGAYDTARDRLLVFGGGHADSYYNQVFAFDLGQLRWLALSAPTRDATPERTQPWLDEPFYEPCGYYPNADLPIDEAWRRPEYREFIRPELCTSADIEPRLDKQQPRSAHTYGNLAYVPALDALCTTGSIGMWRSGQSATRVTACFDLARRRWIEQGLVPRAGYGMSAVDGEGHVWLLHEGGLAELDPATGAWTARGAGRGVLYASVAIEPTTRTLFVLTPGDASLVSRTLGATPGADVARAPPPAGLRRQNPGFVWVPHLSRFYAWAGGRTLYTYDPARDAWATVEGLGDDPGEPSTNGTYGRLRLSAHRRVLVLANSTQRDVAIYKLP